MGFNSGLKGLMCATFIVMFGFINSGMTSVFSVASVPGGKEVFFSGWYSYFVFDIY